MNLPPPSLFTTERPFGPCLPILFFVGLFPAVAQLLPKRKKKLRKNCCNSKFWLQVVVSHAPLAYSSSADFFYLVGCDVELVRKGGGGCCYRRRRFSEVALPFVGIVLLLLLLTVLYVSDQRLIILSKGRQI